MYNTPPPLPELMAAGVIGTVFLAESEYRLVCSYQSLATLPISCLVDILEMKLIEKDQLVKLIYGHFSSPPPPVSKHPHIQLCTSCTPWRTSPPKCARPGVLDYLRKGPHCWVLIGSHSSSTDLVTVLHTTLTRVEDDLVQSLVTTLTYTRERGRE